MLMGKGLFITGTGTEVGKTVVAAGILCRLRGAGLDAVPMKPVQTGAEPRGKDLCAPDLEFCLTAAGLDPADEDRQLMAPYRYLPACSPHLAGELERRFPKLERIVDCAVQLGRQHDLVVAEGAGGIMVPLDRSTTMLDLMNALGFPVVLVAHSGLGTINHTLLSLKALRGAGLRVIGVVLNDMGPASGGEDVPIEEDNLRTIAGFGGVKVLGRLGHLGEFGTPGLNPWKTFSEQLPGLDRILEEINNR